MPRNGEKENRGFKPQRYKDIDLRKRNEVPQRYGDVGDATYRVLAWQFATAYGAESAFEGMHCMAYAFWRIRLIAERSLITGKVEL